MSSSLRVFSTLLTFVLLLTFHVDTSESIGRSSGRRADKWNMRKEEEKPGNNINRSSSTYEKQGNGRRGKLFSLFNIVTFKNDPCTSTATTTAGNNRNGTCMTSTECADRTGMAMGNCAAGFGVCCIFVVNGLNGNTQVTQNCTYIQNQDFPNPQPAGATSLMFNVLKCNNDVCFLRLDFEMFSLLGTGGSSMANEGVCISDTFTVTGLGPVVQIPTICGENSGQHIYVDIGAMAGDTATLGFNIGALAGMRMWDVKVTQVECDNANAPPETCLQYMTGLTGRIETFNFRTLADNHLNDQLYSICIRQESGFCCVQYQVCADQTSTDPATVIPPGFSFDAAVTTAMNDDVCAMASTDHISIPESRDTCNPTGASSAGINSRYCGRVLNFFTGATANAPICDCTAPFTVDIFFNNVDDNPDAAATINNKQSRGLCLEYMQVPC